MKRSILLVLCGTAAFLGFGPARALADGTVSANGVTATLTSNQQQFDQTLSIGTHGAPAFSDTLPCVDAPCGGTIQVKRINPGPRPDVILTSFAEGGGGAILIDDFSWSVPRDTWVDSQGGYSLLQGPEPALEPLGGGFSGFVTHAGLGGLTFGFSGVGPIVIQRPILGRLVDVTGRFPAVVTADAAQWLTVYQAAPEDDNVEPIAAWAADESLLGHHTAAAAFLESQDGLLFQNGNPISAAAVEQTLAADGYPLSS